MFTHNDLEPSGGSQEQKTFNYLLGVTRKKFRSNDDFAERFESALHSIVTAEEQSDTAKELFKYCSFLRKDVLPTAPLTVTNEWSPFALANSLLASCLAKGRQQKQDQSNAAYSVWTPELKIENQAVLSSKNGEVVAQFDLPRKASDLDFRSEDEYHFYWLLSLTIERARKLRRNVILLGYPGYKSYSDELRRMKPNYHFLEAGYLYPSGMPHPLRFRKG
ncbi:hypothetical protein GCM10007100_39940 [Roseibacillus persicicus]|uniref:Uncharacterized protein n=1 Tax=Roseibacillus persicicus TaxID=454148 RepID=A0A918TY26_9BACT|nr:hypothetical protein GCM10007100_39940 [Roseibacillus persicicus]